MCTRVCLEMFGIFFSDLGACSVAQSCMTLCNTIDCSPSGSSVHGISQARILEWLPFPAPGDLPNPGIKPPKSPALAGGFFAMGPPGKDPVSIAMIDLSHLRFFSEQRLILECAFQGTWSERYICVSIWERYQGMWQRDRPSENNAHK